MRHRRWIVVALALLTLGLRLVFVLRLPDRALFWDEPLYNNWGIVYQHAWSGDAASGVTLREAFQGSLQKGELYAASVGLVYAVCGASPRALYVLQAVLDTVTALLLYGLARVLAGERAGLMALALAAFYEPFIFTAARLQTETLTALLTVATLWALCVPERRRAVGHTAAGVLAAAAMLARPALQYLLPVLLPLILVRNADRAWRARSGLALCFAAGFFAVAGPHLVATRLLTGEAVWAGTLNPSIDMYAGAVVDNVGWKTDRLAFVQPPRDELLAVVGTRHPITQDDYRAATLRTWFLHPFDSAAVMLHKLYVAWSYPYNDAHWTFLVGRAGTAWWHQVVLVLGLVGMPLALHRRRVGILVVTATLYLWLTYLVVKIEVRYAAIATSMMVCFAGVALADLSHGWQHAWQTGRRRQLAGLAAGVAIGVMAASTLTTERLLRLLPLTPDGAHAVRVGVILAAIGCCAYAAAELTQERLGRASARLLLVPALGLAALVVLFGSPITQDWREWQCTLTPNHGVASQEFVLPDKFQPPQSARLRLDLLPAGSGPADLVVRVNGEELKRYRGGPTRADADLPDAHYFEQIVGAQRRDTEADPAWYTIDIPVELVQPGAHISVEVALAGEDAATRSVVLFGDYSPDRSTYAGPSLLSPGLTADTSLYRYLAEGDFRMRRRIQVSGASHSRFSDGSGWSDSDLAFDAGRQQGRYRIFLLLEYGRGMAVL
jgi:4-amino-4-deoxy-L-arabinose transferase-like glycosyltransferase